MAVILLLLFVIDIHKPCRLLMFCIFLLAALHLVQVKLWDLSNNQPSCVASTNPKVVSDYYSFSYIWCHEVNKNLLNILLRANIALDKFSCFFVDDVRELSFPCPSQRTAPFCWLWEALRGNWKWVKKSWYFVTWLSCFPCVIDDNDWSHWEFVGWVFFFFFSLV